MRFIHVLPAAMLMTAVTARPVQKLQAQDYLDHSRRQISGLTGILKGIMDSSGDSGSGASTGPVAPTTSADTITFQQCSDAIAKIEAALSISARYMKAAGGAPTPQEIQAVLIVLQQSLGADCDDGFMLRDTDVNSQRRSEGPLAGILGDGNGNGNPLGIGILGGGSGDEYRNEGYSNEDCEVDEYCEKPGEGTVDKRVLTTSRCSDCERQLYHIVNELQLIFALGVQGTSTVPGLSSSVAAVPATTLPVPPSQLTYVPIVLTTTSLLQATGMSHSYEYLM